jgi:Ala-tRNA(Pro) deacylase
MIKMDLLKKAVGSDNVRLATEQEFKDKFIDCEVGAMPPFGNLYGIDVYVAESLREDEEIVFNAGTHTELIKMSYKDFEKLVNPKTAQISYKTKL